MKAVEYLKKISFCLLQLRKFIARHINNSRKSCVHKGIKLFERKKVTAKNAQNILRLVIEPLYYKYIPCFNWMRKTTTKLCFDFSSAHIVCCMLLYVVSCSPGLLLANRVQCRYINFESLESELLGFKGINRNSVSSRYYPK